MPATTDAPASASASADAPRVVPAVGPDLAYEQQTPWYAQRRAFRLIVLLLLLNIVAVTSITWGPLSVRAFQDALAARQAAAQTQAAAAQAQATAAANAAALQAAVAKRSALLKQCAAFQMPAGLVVYTEDPAEAARLLADGKAGYSAVSQHQTTSTLLLPHVPVAWGGSSAELRTTIVAAVANATYPPDGTLFLHGLTTPGGTSRIVWVQVSASRSLIESHGGNGALAVLPMRREIQAQVIDPVAPPGGGVAPTLWRYQLQIIQPDARRRAVPLYPLAPGERGPVTRPGEVLRLLAGRPDPADPSRLLLDYTLDGEKGTLAFRLLDDDRLRLDVDRGVATIERFDTAEGRGGWDPRAVPTSPAK
jgi:hypothetical protein